MNGVQIERLLDAIEEKSAAQRPLLRREMTRYIGAHSETLVEQLVKSGEAYIPTSFGGIRLTREDLDAVAA